MQTTRPCLAALLLLLSPLRPAADEEPPPPGPTAVSATAVLGNGHAQTWDGRVFIKTDPGFDGWAVSVFRPEAQTKVEGNPPPQLDMADGAFSTWRSLLGNSASGFRFLNSLAIHPDPGFDENPFRSNEHGLPDPKGEYETYKMILTTTMPFLLNTSCSPECALLRDCEAQEACENDASCTPLQIWTEEDLTACETPQDPIPENCPSCLRESRIGQRSATVVVSAPRTPGAAVVTGSATGVGPFLELRTAADDAIRGIEPTLTIDGRLMIYQGHVQNDGHLDQLMYSFNEDPEDVLGWSSPKSVLALFHEREVDIDGIALGDRYPIAQKPWRLDKDTILGTEALETAAMTPYSGGYPWLSRDGSELFHTSYKLEGKPLNSEPSLPEKQCGCTSEATCLSIARRGGLAVIGRATGYTLRLIDGPLNPDRTQTLRLFTSSPGLTPGMWKPFRDVRDVRIPFTQGRPLYPIFSSNSASYGEVSFEDHEDGDYLLVLHMNEALKNGNHLGWVLDPTQTSDTSGQGYRAQLEGASFPQEYSGRDACSPDYPEVDRNEGVGGGQAIYFCQGSALRVPDFSGHATTDYGFTVEFWIRRESDTGLSHQVARHAGAWAIELGPNGGLSLTLEASPNPFSAIDLQIDLPLHEWVHVAISHRYATNQLNIYRSGLSDLPLALPGPSQPIPPLTSDLVLGPNEGASCTGEADCDPCIQNDPNNPTVFRLDELKISRVVRSAEEIARSAFLDAPAANTDGILPFELPTGLDAADLKLPETLSLDQITLGKQLFFDPRLSSNGLIACSTCHDPAFGFADSFTTPIGVSDVSLRRNAPSLINRAFSTVQLWDGRADSLEAQAILPIEHMDEMGSSAAQAVATVQSIPEYAAAFQSVYESAPTVSLLQTTLSAFQRSLVSGHSPVDQYEAALAAPQDQEEEGHPGLEVLGASAQRGRLLFHGKARCVACHDGSNYTDEAFHNTGFFADSHEDAGRGEVTRRSRDRGRFKTPTLRELVHTAPYLHDGSVATLEDVVQTYSDGGVTGGTPDGALFPLNLTAFEMADLVAFLEVLGSPEDGPLDRTPPSLPGGVLPGRAPTFTGFVERLYGDLLGRPADPGGLGYYAGLLSQNTSRQTVVDTLIHSNESLGHLVQWGFEHYLDRPAEPTAVDHYVGRLASDLTLRDFWFLLATSDEYRHSSGIGPGSNPAFITELYRDILEREPDAGGLAWYLNELDQHGEAHVVRLMLDSSEAREVETRRVYQELLCREPKAEEISAYSEGVFDLRKHVAAGLEYFLRSAQPTPDGCH